MRDLTLLQREGTTFRYLGYLLTLGKAEMAVLAALTTTPDEGIDGFDLEALCGVSRKNIPTVVASINRKAAVIGGRKLILSGHSTGYRLTAFL